MRVMLVELPYSGDTFPRRGWTVYSQGGISPDLAEGIENCLTVSDLVTLLNENVWQLIVISANENAREFWFEADLPAE